MINKIQINKLISPLFVLLFSTAPALPPSQNSNDQAAASPVIRGPITVTLHTKNGEYKENFDKVPYVDKNKVYIFPGETFGVNVTISGDEISGISYQKDIDQADVSFEFLQDQGSMMMLLIKSKLKRVLYLDAFMNLPGRKESSKTSITPVNPSFESAESWPHPIVKIALMNFRFSGKPSK